MGRSETSARRGHHAWSLRGGLLALVVLGILGMHGLDIHGPPQAVHTDATSIASASSHHADDANDAGNPTTRAHASPTSDASVSSAERSTAGDLCKIGVCIAALAGLIWLLAMARGRANRPRWRTPLRTHLALPRLRPHLPRPPTLAELSLLRC